MDFNAAIKRLAYDRHLDQVENAARVTSLRTFSDQIF